MKLSFFAFSMVLLFVLAAVAQNYNATNPIPQAAPGPVLQTNGGQAVLPPAPEQPAPFPAVSASEKPAVTITASGTVLNDDQKRQISQRLQEIPGVVVITNRIHVVGEISEAAGAVRTNRGTNQLRRNRLRSF